MVEEPKDSPVTNIFSSIPSKHELPGNVVKKIAAVHPPEENEVSTAITDKVPTPQAFADLENSDCREYISNTEQLIEAINKAKATKKATTTKKAGAIKIAPKVGKSGGGGRPVRARRVSGCAL